MNHLNNTNSVEISHFLIIQKSFCVICEFWKILEGFNKRNIWCSRERNELGISVCGPSWGVTCSTPSGIVTSVDLGVGRWQDWKETSQGLVRFCFLPWVLITWVGSFYENDLHTSLYVCHTSIKSLRKFCPILRGKIPLWL